MQHSPIPHTVSHLGCRGGAVEYRFASRAGALAFAQAAALAAECRGGAGIADEADMRGGRVLVSVGDAESWVVSPDALTTDLLPV